MDFSFPFPSLKNLLIIHVAKEKLVNDIRPLENTDTWNLTATWNDWPHRVDEILDPLPLSPSVKHDLSDVITGMYSQLERILGPNYKYTNVANPDKLELLYDQYGRLEVARIWKRYFEREVINYTTIDPLLQLLERTIRHQLWSGIDVIFSRIMSLRGLNPDSLEKGKLHLTEDEVLGMIYRSHNLSNDVFAQLETLFRLPMEHLYWFWTVNATQDAFIINVEEVSSLDYSLIKDFEGPQPSTNPLEVLPHLIDAHQVPDNPACIVDILKTVDLNTQREYVASLSRQIFGNTRTHDHFLSGAFLMWPFTQFFVSFLELARPNMTIHNYLNAFWDIQEDIPLPRLYGVVRADLLEKLWDAIPPDIKQDIRVRFAAHSNEGGHDVRDIESFKIRLNCLEYENPYIHAKISTDLNSIEM